VCNVPIFVVTFLRKFPIPDPAEKPDGGLNNRKINKNFAEILCEKTKLFLCAH